MCDIGVEPTDSRWDSSFVSTPEIFEKNVDRAGLCFYSVVQSVFALAGKGEGALNVHQALADVKKIRDQLNRVEVSTGFRSIAVSLSVLTVMLGATLQTLAVQDGTLQIDLYLLVWFGVAVGSAATALVEMWVRYRLRQEAGATQFALVARIAPCLLVGFVVTWLIGNQAIEALPKPSNLMWALPALWSMIYSLGLFHCRQHLPGEVVWVAVYFLVAGLLLLGYGSLTRELHGWQMLGSFGAGQGFLAVLLYRNLESGNG